MPVTLDQYKDMLRKCGVDPNPVDDGWLHNQNQLGISPLQTSRLIRFKRAPLKPLPVNAQIQRRPSQLLPGPVYPLIPLGHPKALKFPRDVFEWQFTMAGLVAFSIYLWTTQCYNGALIGHMNRRFPGSRSIYSSELINGSLVRFSLLAVCFFFIRALYVYSPSVAWNWRRAVIFQVVVFLLIGLFFEAVTFTTPR